MMEADAKKNAVHAGSLLPLACRNGFWPFEGFTPYIASCTVCRQKSDKPKRRGFSKRRGSVKKGKLRKQKLELKKLQGLKRCKLDLAMLQCKLFPSDVEHPNTLQHHVISKYTHVSTAARLNKIADFQDGPHQHINPQDLANFSDAAQAHLVEAMAFCDGGTDSILQQSSAKSTYPSPCY